MRRTLADYDLDGGKVLEQLIAESPYGSLPQAVASLALFSHPDTVAQTSGRALFRIVRGPIPQRGHVVDFDDGKPVMLDDNTGPTDAFIWANRIRRGRYADVQFCHIWQHSGDPQAYTNLANMCLLPAFLAKLSDTHADITALLRSRATELYRWRPPRLTDSSTNAPAGDWEWAPTLPANPNVEDAMRSEMRTKPKSRTSISARQIGWLFSGWEADTNLPGIS